jgi:glycosyltransferase involved in cell wall biosynthesis
MEKVSIVTTFFNTKPEYLVEALNSLIKQDYDNKEIIVVDDCSTNKDTIKSFKKWYNDLEMFDQNIIKFIKPENNLGCGGARRFGIENGTGDYFMFLDSDDYYFHTDFVTIAVNKIKDTGADIVTFGSRHYFPNGDWRYTTPQAEKEYTGLNAVLKLMTSTDIRFNAWDKIFTKEIVNSFPYSDARTFEDVRTIPIWLKNSTKIITVPTVEINYRCVDTSIVNSDSLKSRLETIEAISELYEYFTDVNLRMAIYRRAFIDISAVMENKTSNDPGFEKMKELNKKMLDVLIPQIEQTV